MKTKEWIRPPTDHVFCEKGRKETGDGTQTDQGSLVRRGESVQELEMKRWRREPEWIQGSL